MKIKKYDIDAQDIKLGLLVVFVILIFVIVEIVFI
jgi:hypothetical protein